MSDFFYRQPFDKSKRDHSLLAFIKGRQGFVRLLKSDAIFHLGSNAF